jgi:hypothetical protein
LPHEQFVPVADIYGNTLIDCSGNTIVREYGGQQAFARDLAGNFVPVSHEQPLYACSGSGDIFTYRYGIDMV